MFYFEALLRFDINYNVIDGPPPHTFDLSGGLQCSSVTASYNYFFISLKVSTFLQYLTISSCLVRFSPSLSSVQAVQDNTWICDSTSLFSDDSQSNPFALFLCKFLNFLLDIHHIRSESHGHSNIFYAFGRQVTFPSKVIITLHYSKR